MANPWLLVDRAVVVDTVATLRTAAAKHGGNHIEARTWKTKVHAWLQRSVLALLMWFKHCAVYAVRRMHECGTRWIIFCITYSHGARGGMSTKVQQQCEQ